MNDRRLNRRLCVPLVLLFCGGGCSFIDRHASAKSRLPLARATPSSDSVTLEIYFARGPLGDATLNGPLWSAVDEQRLSADLRRRLAENGFRAGVVGSHVPDELARLLTLTDQPPPKTDEPIPINLEEEPNVTLRILQARSGKRNEVICSGIYEQLPLLKREENQLGGRTFSQAEGRFGLKSFLNAPNRVQLELVPELHHGEQQPRWVGSDGVLRLDAGKPREVFDELSTRVMLAPGEMLVMTSLPSRPGSLGHYFFTQPTSERPSQKLLVIRIAQGGSDAFFNSEPADAANVPLGH